MIRQMELFAGAGGGILGGCLAGFEIKCAVEKDEFRREILRRRIEDGSLKRFEIKKAVERIDGEEWKDRVDVISGGFPCQDISAAGRGKGIEEGEKSRLWEEFARVVCEAKPPLVFVENSPRLTVKGIDRILKELAAMGYDAEWEVLSAAECGAYHLRRRMWILGMERGEVSDDLRRRLAESFKESRIAQKIKAQIDVGLKPTEKIEWPCEPRICRVADGVANRVDRIKAIGAAQVPRVFAMAFWGLLMRMKGNEI